MVSDVLSDCRADVLRYLADESYQDWYGKPGDYFYDRLFRLLVEMRVLQFELDAGGRTTISDLAAAEMVRDELTFATADHLAAMEGK